MHTIICSIITLMAAASLQAQSPGAGELDPNQANGALDGFDNPQSSMKSLAKIDPGIPLDPADAPFNLTEPGSYYLTGNVTTVNADTPVIRISSGSGYTIDLRGFKFVAAGGSAVISVGAINLDTTDQSEVTIRNGTIEGYWYAAVFGTIETVGGGVFAGSEGVTCENLRVLGTSNYGIRVGNGARIHGCQIRRGTGANGIISSGIDVNESSQVTQCIVTGCDGDGISTSLSSLVKNCTIRDVDKRGIRVSAHSAVVDCTVYQCGSIGGIVKEGISTSGNGTVSGCVVSMCEGEGIKTGENSTVLDCTSFENGANGIRVASGSLVSRCVVRGNAGNGIYSSGSQGIAVAQSTAFENDGVGIFLENNSVAEGCVAYSNGDGGFASGSGSTLTNCVAGDNTGDGFSGGAWSVTFSNCNAWSNTANGFDVPGTSEPDTIHAFNFTNCVAYMNGESGFNCGNDTLFTACSASNNGGDGFSAVDGCIFDTCSAARNQQGFAVGSSCRVAACVARGNSDNGISVISSNLIVDCIAQGNGLSPADTEADGIEASQYNIIRGCVITSNTGDGINIRNNRNQITGNTCRGNGVYGIDAGNNNNLVYRNLVGANSTGQINPDPGAGGIGDIAPISINMSSLTHPLSNFD